MVLSVNTDSNEIDATYALMLLLESAYFRLKTMLKSMLGVYTLKCFLCYSMIESRARKHMKM